MLIKGSALNAQQRKLVFAAYVHRWTHENAQQTYGGKCPACVQCGGNYAQRVVEKSWHEHHAPLTTDQEWLDTHAFHFTKDGKRLMANRRWAEPVYLADD